MRISELDYDLPQDLIAQEPVRPRDASRMLVLDRGTGRIEHRMFRDLVEYVGRDDVVVLNDTRVIRARLTGRREPGGGRAEVLLLSKVGADLWEALVTPGRRLPPGRRIAFGEGELSAEVLERTASGGRLLRFSGGDDTDRALERLAELPTPPYVHQALREESDYQTVYATELGASAAPTAGLHFTSDMLAEVRKRVRAVVRITLHIGLGTFRPIRCERVENHDMHVERYAISEEAAAVLTQALSEKGRMVAVGTSTARALESAARDDGRIEPGSGETGLFITPGYHFKAVGALLTNFHMPRSTLLSLICAFASRELVMKAYGEAVEMRYRFLSFGDAMLIV